MFDADAADGPAPAQPKLEELSFAWDPKVLESLLVSQGQLLHTAIGKGETDWLYTREELRAIAPPLARILNRYDVTRAAAGTGDELAVVIGLFGYSLRSIKERREAIAKLRAAYEEHEATLAATDVGEQEPPAIFDDELPDVPPTPRRP